MIKKVTLIFLVFCLQSCHYARMARYYTADIDDHKIFPYTEVNNGENIFYFKDGSTTDAAKKLKNLTFSADGQQYKMDKVLDEFSETTAFLVIKDDAIVFEKYYEGYKRDSISNIFSVSKSVTSLLVGIALEEGKIESVHDPITKYIPELNEADPKFKKLTLEHLLDMRSGLEFSETYSSPFDEVSRLYYGKGQLKQISNMSFNYEPGTHHEYQSVCTTLLGIAVERVAQMQLGKYLEAKLWIPLEMENPATWSYDDETNKNTKAFCCLNTTVIDLAKIARLMIHKGKYKGKQIVPKEWVEKLTTPNPENDCYQYQWYSNNCSEDFYALGILGQHIYVSPSDDLIIVRLGKSWTSTDVFFPRIKEVLKG